jgi:hypothetical protein
MKMRNPTIAQSLFSCTGAAPLRPISATSSYLASNPFFPAFNFKLSTVNLSSL